MWCVCKPFNNMEDTCTQWLFNEEGVYLSDLYYFVSTSSSLELQLNAVHKNGANLRHASGLTKPTNLCLLMRVQLTDERHTVEGPGLYVVGKLLEKHFSVVADGISILVVLCGIFLTTVASRFSVLPAMALNGIIHCDIVEGAFDTELFYTFMIHLSLAGCDGTFPSPKFNHRHG